MHRDRQVRLDARFREDSMAADLAAHCPANLFKGLYGILPRDVTEFAHDCPSNTIRTTSAARPLVEKGEVIGEIGETAGIRRLLTGEPDLTAARPWPFDLLPRAKP